MAENDQYTRQSLTASDGPAFAAYLNDIAFNRPKLKQPEGGTRVSTTFQVVGAATAKNQTEDIENKCVLLVTENWIVYKHLNARIKKVLFTTSDALKQMDFAAHKVGYHHIEVFDTLATGSVELKALELHSKHNFTHVICTTEDDLIRTAKMRRMLKIERPGIQTVESAMTFRDKVLMKELCKEKGIKVPVYATVEGPADVIMFTNKHGFPVVVKPRKGCGSIGTTVLRSKQQMEEFILNVLSKNELDVSLDLEVECFIQGNMYHIDGFVYKGVVKAVWPSQYTNVVVDYQANRFIGGFSLEASNPLTKRLQQFAVDVIGALDCPDSFPFHCEAWVTPENEIVLCEIASRTPGGGIRHEVLEMWGIMMDKTWVQCQCEDFVTNEDINKDVDWTTYQKKVDYCVGWLFAYPQTGIFVDFPEDCKLDYCIGYFNLESEKGKQFLSRKSCADATASILVKGCTEKEVLDNLNKVYTWYNNSCVWKALE